MNFPQFMPPAWWFEASMNLVCIGRNVPNWLLPCQPIFAAQSPRLM
jgi:hypothetical protein